MTNLRNFIESFPVQMSRRLVNVVQDKNANSFECLENMLIYKGCFVRMSFTPGTDRLKVRVDFPNDGENHLKLLGRYLKKPESYSHTSRAKEYSSIVSKGVTSEQAGGRVVQVEYRILNLNREAPDIFEAFWYHVKPVFRAIDKILERI